MTKRFALMVIPFAIFSALFYVTVFTVFLKEAPYVIGTLMADTQKAYEVEKTK